MNANPTVSVVVPVYNAEKYIGKCCESIFSQTYENIEVIIVNDGSTDRSMEIVGKLLDGKFAHIKPKVKIINQKNQGSPVARHTGIVNATGDFLIQLDADDWVSKRMVEKMVGAAVREDADFVICKYYNVYKFWKVPRREKRFTDKLAILDSLFSHKHFRAFLWDKMVKRCLFFEGDEFLFPRYPMCEDMIMVAQLVLRAKKIHYINDRLYYYRQTNSASLSCKKVAKRNTDIILNKLDLWDFYERKDKNPLAPLRDSYMLQIAWMGFKSNLTDLLETRPEVLETVRPLPVDPKFLLEIENQEKLKSQIAAYDKFKKTGDPSLKPLFEVEIVEKR